jgi:hypothetical protein
MGALQIDNDLTVEIFIETKWAAMVMIYSIMPLVRLVKRQVSWDTEISFKIVDLTSITHFFESPNPKSTKKASLFGEAFQY